MTPFAQSLLAQARHHAQATRQQPDAVLAEWLAAVLADVARPLEGVSPGYLRFAPRGRVREPKEQRPVVDAVEGESGA